MAMRVDALIKRLQDNYKDSDELLVTYWDKEWVSSFVMDKGDVDEIYQSALDEFEDFETAFGNQLMNFVDELAGRFYE
jgi:hypothetical protein